VAQTTTLRPREPNNIAFKNAMLATQQ